MGKQIQKPGIGKILIWGGILLSIAAYLVIAIPGLYNKSAMHGGNYKSAMNWFEQNAYYNIGM
jgi:hypothetical protein